MIKIRNWPQPQLQRGNICYAITGFLVIVSLLWKCHCSFNLLVFQFVVIGFNWGQFVGCDPNINENRKQSDFYFLDGLVTKRTNFQSVLDGVETSLFCETVGLMPVSASFFLPWADASTMECCVLVYRAVSTSNLATCVCSDLNSWSPAHTFRSSRTWVFPSILTHALGHAIPSPSLCDSPLETQEHKEKTGWCLTTQS